MSCVTCDKLIKLKLIKNNAEIMILKNILAKMNIKITFGHIIGTVDSGRETKKTRAQQVT